MVYNFSDQQIFYTVNRTLNNAFEVGSILPYIYIYIDCVLFIDAITGY